MSDMQSGFLIDKVPDLPEDLQMILGHALDRGKNEMEKGELLVPFTAVLVKDQVLVELHPGDNPEECFRMARHAVEGMRGAVAYAFCYDGYVDTNQGTKDAIIAEGGMPGESQGYALAYLYTIDKKDEAGNPTAVTVEATPTYIGEAGNFMENLTEKSEYVDTDAEDAPSIEKGEELERDNAEEFGEPLKD